MKDLPWVIRICNDDHILGLHSLLLFLCGHRTAIFTGPTVRMLLLMFFSMLFLFVLDLHDFSIYGPLDVKEHLSDKLCDLDTVENLLAVCSH